MAKQARWSLRFFQSHLAAQSFFVLVLGVLLIVIASNSLLSVYLDAVHRSLPSSQIPSMVERAVSEARPDHLLRPRHSPEPPINPALQVKITLKPESSAIKIQSRSPAVIRRTVHQHKEAKRFAVQLSDGRWLNIYLHENQRIWTLAGLGVAALVLLLALIFLCAWSVKRLALPFQLFADAAKRFGVDVQAPPLAVVGAPEMQEAIKAYNEMQNRIRRLLHDRTQMLAAISHDLRTPITRLQLRAEYLKETNQYEKAIADLAEMEQMISSILSFARDYVNTEKMEKLDLNALLESICDDLSDMGHSVTFSAKGRSIYFGRVAALKRAFSNLIENAIKYGHQADVWLKQESDALYIKISDQGPGVPDAQLEKVFDPFYRADPARSPQVGGTGLGLTVARDIIRAHGGEVTLANQKCGLLVTVTLPCEASASLS